MKDLGAAKKILGMEISRDRPSGKVYLGQKGYIDKVLRRFNMHNAKPVSTPLAAHFKLSQPYVLSQMQMLSTCLEFPIRVQLVHLCMPWFVLVRIYHMH